MAGIEPGAGRFTASRAYQYTTNSIWRLQRESNPSFVIDNHTSLPIDDEALAGRRRIALRLQVLEARSFLELNLWYAYKELHLGQPRIGRPLCY